MKRFTTLLTATLISAGAVLATSATALPQWLLLCLDGRELRGHEDRARRRRPLVGGRHVRP
ncbi:hypothetical protein T261_7540 [Streptomyces lydicus]|nr:hypothetical protein T261_7540 [Streptomyces lydicus]